MDVGAVSPVNRIAIATNEIREEFEDAVRIGMAWGLRSFEVKVPWPNSRVPTITPQQEKVLYDTFGSEGLTCVAISPGVFMGPYTPASYREELGKLEKSFAMAERLGTSLIIVFSFQRGHASPDAAMPSEQVGALREAAQRAEDRGILLAMENMANEWADTGANSRRVLELVDHGALKLNWDPGNAAHSGDPSAFPDGYQTVKQFMAHFHLKNYGGEGEDVWTPLPDGEIDYTAHLRQVVADGYSGWFVVETHCRPLEANSKTNLRFLRQVLGRQVGGSC